MLNINQYFLKSTIYRLYIIGINSEFLVFNTYRRYRTAKDFNFLIKLLILLKIIINS